jgi:hypothetical protein
MITWGCFQEFGKHPSFSEIQNGMYSSRSRAIHGAPVPQRGTKEMRAKLRESRSAICSLACAPAAHRHIEGDRAHRERERERETMVPHPCGVKQTQISNPALTCETGSQCPNPPYCVKQIRMCKVQTSHETEPRHQNLAVLCETNLDVQTCHVISKKTSRSELGHVV